MEPTLEESCKRFSLLIISSNRSLAKVKPHHEGEAYINEATVVRQVVLNNFQVKGQGCAMTIMQFNNLFLNVQVLKIIIHLWATQSCMFTRVRGVTSFPWALVQGSRVGPCFYL